MAPISPSWWIAAAGRPKTITMVALRRLGLLDLERRHLSPQRLEAVVLACGGREDVHDAVEVVHQNPAALRGALDALRDAAGALAVLEVLVDRVLDGVRLALGVTGG